VTSLNSKFVGKPFPSSELCQTARPNWREQDAAFDKAKVFGIDGNVWSESICKSSMVKAKECKWDGQKMPQHFARHHS